MHVQQRRTSSAPGIVRPRSRSELALPLQIAIAAMIFVSGLFRRRRVEPGQVCKLQHGGAVEASVIYVIESRWASVTLIRPDRFSKRGISFNIPAGRSTAWISGR
jgi:hypothetical protein